MSTASLHPDGLDVSSTSPAHIVLSRGTGTAAIESYASKRGFAWVAVGDHRGWRDGTDCFADAHLPVMRSLIDNFADGPLKYSGLLLPYSSWYFGPGI